MVKHVIDADNAATAVVEDSNSEWTLAKGVLLTGATGIQNYSHDFVHFTISGAIDSSYAALQSVTKAGTDDAANGTSVVVTAKANVYGEQSALQLGGIGTSLENAGKIRSAQTAVTFSDGDIEIVNTGEIAAEFKAIEIFDATTCSITNTGRIIRGSEGAAVTIEVGSEGQFINGASGVIKGDVDAFASSGDLTFRNNGIIKSTDAAIPLGIYLGAGDDHLINRGRMGGTIELGAGNDIADLRKGKLFSAVVSGQDGNDTFILDNASVVVEEMTGDGSDTIKTSVSYTLGNDQSIETLTAIGKKDISLTGNNLGNVLNGNAGSNALSGGGGTDMLVGGSGKDILTGGTGVDHFFFYAEGGVDTITDFAPDSDVIHIIKIDGIDDFDDLQSRMSTIDFDGDKDFDTVIDLGSGGKIRLADVSKLDLEMSDFSIFAA